MRTLEARRYVTPLKEGGSLPAVVDTEDGLFVVKFRGAGQGARALIAEILVAGFAELLDLHVPEVALIDLGGDFGRSERDPEIQDILRGSVGTNVGLAYLEGAFNFDGAADEVDEETASRLVWLDSFTSNVDRTARNPNLMWTAADGDSKGVLWLIDHGAALYFHHSWEGMNEARQRDPFALSSEHVLLGRATRIEAADALARARLAGDIETVVERVPDALLMDSPVGGEPPFASAAENRAAYVRYFTDRLESSAGFVEKALEGHVARLTEGPERKGYRR